MKLESSDSNLFQKKTKKKSEQNRTLRLSKSSEHNFTLKPSVKQLASEEKFTRQECGGTQGVFVFWIFFFFLSFIWLGLSICFSLLHASTCHHGTLLLHTQMIKNMNNKLPVHKWSLSWVDVETAQG